MIGSIYKDFGFAHNDQIISGLVSTFPEVELFLSKDPELSDVDFITVCYIGYGASDSGFGILISVAKPLFVDGSAKSHELFLAYDEVSLSKLEPPLVLQEFVNHGGVMFKVYVVGDTIKVVRRFSLPDVCKREISKYAGVFQFPRVSGATATAEEADLDPGVAELPPRPLLETLVRELRSRMGLQLFNIDMIREHGTSDMFYFAPAAEMGFTSLQLFNIRSYDQTHLKFEPLESPPSTQKREPLTAATEQPQKGILSKARLYQANLLTYALAANMGHTSVQLFNTGSYRQTHLKADPLDSPPST
ncbi:hypothetical protein Cgig2_019500 [Carnegiea gigantea]|uniref:inositol-1,3,4-trisphosphate 5/6-kinase n=1 Tax=Carnegiea gigantea TaxID=171969 RepID=A0A9Q1KMZ3_9CARY|nr:hypothetical protein Cgig2_019500 [Carnegiea gigantea]